MMHYGDMEISPNAYTIINIMQNRVKEAIQHFNAGNYESALAAFLAAAEVYGEKHFAYNIRLCRQRLNTSATNTDHNNKSFVNDYFDHVYLVNLPRHVERRLKSAIQLRNASIDFELYTATDGYQGAARETYERYMSRGIGQLTRYPEYNEQECRRAKMYIESPGAVGYIYTYLSILKDAQQKGYKRFLIVEDDVIFCDDFESRLRLFLSKIDPDWKVLQLGASQYGWQSVDEVQASMNGYYFPRRLDTCGSFAIAFDKSVIDELIAAESAFDAPFDHLPLGEIYERYYKQCYVAYPNLIMPDVTDSSIRGTRCQISHSIKMKWEIENFNYPLPKPTVALFLSNKENAKYLPTFASKKDLPFDLRVYYYSEDGPRPVHNLTWFDASNIDFYPIPTDLVFPEVDFCLFAVRNVGITDRDIIEYLDQDLTSKRSHEAPLVKLPYAKTQVVSGRVSVIIPTYKRPENLRAAVESVALQDHNDVEIIVVSDNGKGAEFNAETRSIIDGIRKSHPDRAVILLEHSINRNGAAARNTGLFQSTGEFVCFLDDDDIFLQGRLSKAVERLMSTKKEIGATYCGFLGWNSPANDPSRYPEGDLSLQILRLDYKSHYLHTNTATYKRQAVMSINGFDESYRRHQDLEFNLRFFEKYKICSLQETLVRLNPAPSAISNKIFNRSFFDLKIKFLSQFDKTISLFGEEVAREIYFTHWRELLRYTDDKDALLNELKSEFRNGSLAVSGLITQIKG